MIRSENSPKKKRVEKDRKGMKRIEKVKIPHANDFYIPDHSTHTHNVYGIHINVCPVYM